MLTEKVYEARYSNDYGYLGNSKFSLKKQILIDYILSKGFELNEYSKHYAKYEKGEFEYVDILEHDLLNQRSNQMNFKKTTSSETRTGTSLLREKQS